MDVKFYTLNALPTANAKAAGSFVNVTTGANAGVYYCNGTSFLKLDNVAQDKAGEVKTATVDTATGVASFKNASGVEVFTLSLADYITAEVAKLTGSATIATATNGVVTIKTGVTESAGKISNAAGADITLAKVATTGKAEDIALDPSVGIGDETKKANVQEAIGAIVTAFDGLSSDLEAAVSAEKTRAEKAESDILAAVSTEESRAKGVESAISTSLSSHTTNTTVHITSDERTAWNAKQNAFPNAAVLSGITADQVTAWDAVSASKDAYDTHVSDTVKHITADERTAWDAEKGAKTAAATAQASANTAISNASAEKTRAEAAELAIATRVSSLENNTADADAIVAEVSRAKDAEAALSTRLDTLEGEGAGSVKKTATDAAAAAVASVIANAPSKFDTLKEIADWIESDTTSAASLATTVASNTAAISTEKTRAEEAELAIATRVSTLEGKPAASITAAQISNWNAVYASKTSYDAHVSNTDIHVTTDDKATWNAKQDAFPNATVLSGISAADVTAWNSAASANHTHTNKSVLDGITSAKVTNWDAAYTHVSDTVKHITDEERSAWDSAVSEVSEIKTSLNELQLNEIFSITSADVRNFKAVAASKNDYDDHVADTNVHITTDERTSWNGAATHVSDSVKHITATERNTWNAITSTVVGTSTDASTADTINGAKAYADAAVSNALVWLTTWPTA